jgi:hypothetical protein
VTNKLQIEQDEKEVHLEQLVDKTNILQNNLSSLGRLNLNKNML